LLSLRGKIKKSFHIRITAELMEVILLNVVNSTSVLKNTYVVIIACARFNNKLKVEVMQSFYYNSSSCQRTERSLLFNGRCCYISVIFRAVPDLLLGNPAGFVKSRCQILPYRPN